MPNTKIILFCASRPYRSTSTASRDRGYVLSQYVLYLVYLLYDSCHITVISSQRKFLRFSYFEQERAQLSLTNQRDAKACQKLLKFDVLTSLSLTIAEFSHLTLV